MRPQSAPEPWPARSPRRKCTLVSQHPVAQRGQLCFEHCGALLRRHLLRWRPSLQRGAIVGGHSRSELGPGGCGSVLRVVIFIITTNGTLHKPCKSSHALYPFAYIHLFSGNYHPTSLSHRSPAMNHEPLISSITDIINHQHRHAVRPESRNRSLTQKLGETLRPGRQRPSPASPVGSFITVRHLEHI